MTEELDPKFTRCLVKKSKYYFKQELIVIGAIIIAGIVFAALLAGLDWISTVINLERSAIYVIIVLDVAVAGIISIVCTADTLNNRFIEFLKFFSKLHMSFIILLFLLAIEFSCFFGIPVLAMILIWILCVDVFAFGFAIGILGVAITGFVLFPINYSAFICLKVDPCVDEQWKKVVAWL